MINMSVIYRCPPVRIIITRHNNKEKISIVGSRELSEKTERRFKCRPNISCHLKTFLCINGDVLLSPNCRNCLTEISNLSGVKL